jgi:hypothetical protein
MRLTVQPHFPRAQFTLYKPRTLAFGYVIVPTSELSHPLRHFPYYENLPPVPWSKEKKAVPVGDSLAKANTILVSTMIRW